MEEIQKLLTTYSKNLGVNEYEISGQTFSAHHAFSADGLLPLFLQKAKEVSEQLKYEKLYESSGFQLVKDHSSLTGERVDIKQGSFNRAMGIMLIVDVIHSELDMTKIIKSAISDDVSNINSLSLNGILETYSLDELNQGKESGNQNPFMKAALSNNAVGI